LSITPPATVINQFPWNAPVMAVSVPTGQATFPSGSSSPYTAASTAIQGFQLAGYVGPQARMIGGGLEVLNTTEDLHKSGAVVYYTHPSQQRFVGTSVADSGSGAQTSYSGFSRIMRSPPATVAQAVSIPDSVKRKAEEGAYVVFRQAKGQKNPPIDPQGERPIFMGGPNLDEDGSVQVWGFGEAVPVAVFGAYQPVPLLGNHQQVPFDISGAYFTGLSSFSSLDITLRLYIEGFPTPAANQSLISLTRPCPLEDPLACEIYSRVCTQLPPGVPVIENETGDWFKGLMKTIASVAPTIGSALGGIIPGGGLIGSGVGKVAEMLSGIKLGEKAQAKVDKERLAIEERSKAPMMPVKMIRLSPAAQAKAQQRRKVVLLAKKKKRQSVKAGEE